MPYQPHDVEVWPERLFIKFIYGFNAGFLMLLRNVSSWPNKTFNHFKTNIWRFASASFSFSYLSKIQKYLDFPVLTAIKYSALDKKKTLKINNVLKTQA